jgi:hypothetical protein
MKTHRYLLLASAVMFSGTALAQDATIDNIRSYSKTGINQFETPKKENAKFDGLKVSWGGGFNQTFQMLKHENGAKQLGWRNLSGEITNTGNANTDNRDRNVLMPIGNEFNNEQANLMLDVQLDEGVRMHLTTYLSARHHQEAWVKGGYIQFDAIPFLPFDFVSDFMKYTTVKIGHMEINYGDAHFRRNDGGHTLYNPFIENYIMDAFTTEIGAEVYYQRAGFMGMFGVTNGEIKGDVSYPEKKAPSYLAKIGYDKNLSDDLRVRVTGSLYTTTKSASNTLYGGDRTGSHYFYVMDPEWTSFTANTNTYANTSPVSTFTSGRFNPGMRSALTAFVINPFVKFGGLELFGNYEVATGRSNAKGVYVGANKSVADSTDRKFTQIAADVLYRFGSKEQFYVGGRWNQVSGETTGLRAVERSNPNDATSSIVALNSVKGDISINRIAIAGGWFINDYAVLKAEYVMQTYKDFPEYDIRHEGKFNGFVIEATIGF